MHADILRLDSALCVPSKKEQRRLSVLDSYCVLDSQPDALCDLVMQS